jgi:thioredoxin-dependent peroxiredoxin
MRGSKAMANDWPNPKAGPRILGIRMALQVGSQAPDFTLLYFYPKADTPGCTREACSFRDDFPRIEAANTVVLGVSPDKPEALAKFKAKYSLPFTLLSDLEHAVAEQYGVWTLKKNYGKEYMGIERTTFVIGTDGKIARLFPKVKVDGHSEAVLAALAEIQG